MASYEGAQDYSEIEDWPWVFRSRLRKARMFQKLADLCWF